MAGSKKCSKANSKKNAIMSINIYESHVEVVDNAEGLSKTILPDDLLQLLALCKNDTVVRSGRLPKNTLDIAFCELGDKKQVLMFVEHGTFTMKTMSRAYENIAYPSLLFLFVLKGERIVSTSIAALKNVDSMDQIKNSTPLYDYPFVHVYQNHSVCWGNSELPKIKSLNQLAGIPFLFLDSTYHTTNHVQHKNNLSKLSMDDLLESFEKQGVNINDILKPSGYNYKQFCDRMLSSTADDEDGDEVN